MATSGNRVSKVLRVMLLLTVTIIYNKTVESQSSSIETDLDRQLVRTSLSLFPSQRV